MADKKSITVNKIGGSNMDQLAEVANLVTYLQRQGESPILVVSAFKEVTNKLHAALGRLDETDYDEAQVREAFADALQIVSAKVDQFLTDPELNTEAHGIVQRELDICVQQLLTHKQVTTALSPSDETYSVRDTVIAFGERTAAPILALYLQQQGFFARVIGDVTYKGNDHIPERDVSTSKLHEGIRQGIAEAMKQQVNAIEDTILIFGGHVKNALRGMIPEIGRSYTDTTAVDVAIALQELCGLEIAQVVAWKDVDGISSAPPEQLDDPNGTKRIYHDDVSFSEALELAGSGSQVMQTGALIEAMNSRIPLAMRNIKKPSAVGTHFSQSSVLTKYPFKIVMANKAVDTMTFEIPTMADQAGFAAHITSAFAQEGISINDILTSRTTICYSFNLPPGDQERMALREKLRRIQRSLERMEVKGDIYQPKSEWDKGKANIVIIGNELKGRTGINATIKAVLAAEGINIDGEVQVLNERAMSVYVPEKDAHKAVQAIHRFFLEKDRTYGAAVITRMQKIMESFLE